MKILLAEDDYKLARLITHMLEKEMYAVDWVEGGEDAYHYAMSGQYDVVILDWMLPHGDGIQVSQRLRRDGYEGALLMLTARDGVDDRVLGLNSGVDDYLVKPFEFKELFARLRALSRRRYYSYEQETIRVADLEIDLVNHQVRCQDQLVNLTPREFQLMELLARHRSQVMTKEIILERIWGFDSDVTKNTLEAFVKLLRKKLNDDGKKYIQTVRGIGYRLGE